jgi:putative DNA-invertase from lambdoid prophage Rac
VSRVFAYARVSTTGQTTENQLQEIAAAGFAVERRRVVSETVSGSESIARRRGFGRLLDRMEQGDVIVVTRLDRLGRDAIDVSGTVSRLAEMGVRVHCLALGGMDLTSSAGRMTMGVINAVAQFERDLLIERTQSGLARARKKGKRIGRPPSLDPARRAGILEGLDRSESLSGLARRYGTSRQTIMRLRNAERPPSAEGEDDA